MAQVSRRKLAALIGDRLLAGESAKKLMEELAAYLLVHNQSKRAELYVRDIEAYLESRGQTLADVTTARKIDEKFLSRYVSALLDKSESEVHVRSHIDPSLVGGLRLETPSSYLDASIDGRLKRLRTS